MPGYNQRGPKGNGRLTGQRRGMCKRTGKLPYPTSGSKHHKDMSGWWSFADFSEGDKAQRKRRFAQGEAQAAENKKESVDNELTELKKQHRETSEALNIITQKIKTLESKI